MNFYNEHDPNAAAWLRELIERGLIPAGVVDERSITEIQPHELHGYTQCHFFAGIGGWSLALRLAGWPDTEPVWTGSCPCQPFSVAGKGLGTADERHLWPVFCDLIAQCRPECVFGEQVASAIGKGWLDGVSADLEANGYACGSAVLGAHSLGAPHQRQRLYWVANATSDAGAQYERESRGGTRRAAGPCDSAECGSDSCGLADATSGGFGVVGDAAFEGSRGHTHRSIDAGSMALPKCTRWETTGLRSEIDAGRESEQRCTLSGLVLPNSDGRTARDESATPTRHGDSVEPTGSGDCGMADTNGGNASAEGIQCGGKHGCGKSGRNADGLEGDCERAKNFWSHSRLIHCRDGKLRRIPTLAALFPLADGLPYKLARRGSIRPALLKGAGNAIVPQVAAEFIMAFLDIKTPTRVRDLSDSEPAAPVLSERSGVRSPYSPLLPT